MKLKKPIVFALVTAAWIAVIIWTVWGDTALELNTYTVYSNRLPEEFSGERIAHISDLHNAEMGEGNEKLLAMLKAAEPDIIAMTGDMIDSRQTNIEIVLQFVAAATKIAPCYYVTGNHESRPAETFYRDYEERLKAAGVTVLHDRKVILERGGASISLIGIDDPDFAEKYSGGVGINRLPGWLGKLSAIDGFTILLSHRPEFFRQYVKAEIDLVLSGHAHGGQFRLPFIGGLIAPNQGLLPKYDAGLYTELNTNMAVSRGIGSSLFPFRFNNRPEVILIELKKPDAKFQGIVKGTGFLTPSP